MHVHIPMLLCYLARVASFAMTNDNVQRKRKITLVVVDDVLVQTALLKSCLLQRNTNQLSDLFFVPQYS